VRIVRRSGQMLRAAALALGVALATARREREGPRGARAAGRGLVRLCTELGATFIKVGQIASTRADLLPPALVVELATLQDRVPPFAFADVRRTVERELGRPLEAIFDAFEPVPVAAASVAQVHRALLRSAGERVAVKVRRPDILDKARLDRSILLFLARNLERVFPTLRLVALEGAMRTFCDAIEQQIDLRNELAHNLRFARDFAEDPDISVPRIFPEACSEGVLTMEFVEGIPESELSAHDVDVDRIVRCGLRGVCRMIFRNGFVHADLHPGNLRFLAPGRIVALDLGLVGEIDDHDRLATARMLFALATGDGPTVARIFHEESPHPATRDYPAYEREMCEFVASVRAKGLAHLQVSAEIGRIFDILRRHHVQARAHMTMVNLAIMTAEGLSKRLAPDVVLAEEVLPYLAEALGAAAPRLPRDAA
jgi:ubiquinone biosynthesis protein